MNTLDNTNIQFVFFGTPQLSVFVLEELEKKGLLPSLVVTAPDKPQGRKMLLTPPPSKVWAEGRNIPVLQPEKLDEDFIQTLNERTPENGWHVFVVVAYGKILPKALLELPEHGVLNVHPSLLPKFRGASPVRSAILEDAREVGVTVMLLDEEMDHGPILAQEKVAVHEWPARASELEEALLRRGGELLADALPRWVSGDITPQEQNHSEATYTKKIKKEDGLIDLHDDPHQNLLKIRAYDGWPGAYFLKDDKRIKITDAELESGALRILRVIPEGKSEMDYQVFLQK